MISDKELFEYLNSSVRDTFTSRFAEALFNERQRTKRLEKQIENLKRLSDSQEECMDKMDRGVM